jgi:hypothetical protein
MARSLIAFFVLLNACSSAVDRSPPLRDVGLPPVPPPPAELLEFDAGPSADLSALNLAVPEGCSLQTQSQSDRRALRCAARFDAAAPAGWSRVGELPIWRKDGMVLVQSWQKTAQAWVLTQSLHQSKGDHPLAGSPFGSASSKAPQ